MRILIIAWAAVLVLFVGGASWIQLSYDPEAYKEVVPDTTDAAMTTPSSADETPAADGDDDSTTDTDANSDDPSGVPADTAPSTLSADNTAMPQDTPPQMDTLTPADSTQDYAISFPQSELMEEGPYGPLPVIKNHEQPWRVYARPFGGTSRPKVAILMIGAGLNEKLTERALKDLPGEVGFGFSPYALNAAQQTGLSRTLGHEVFMMTPMEPNNYPTNDPGPHSLLTNLTAAENLDRLYFILSRFQGYVGLVNDMGSRFTASDVSMTPIIKDIQRRGLMFVDARNSRFTVAANTARDLGVAHASNERFIDNTITMTAIDSQLEALATTAKLKGVALGLARPYPISIERIRLWARTLDAMGVELVPVTAIASVGRRQE